MPRLTTVAFFNPTSGYGLFSAGSTSSCSAEVGATSNGGATFGPLVRVGSCSELTGGSVAFDDHGDGFLFSASSRDLFVTHDGGATWTTAPQSGDVLSVEALGYSVWMLLAGCPSTSVAAGPPACPLTVRESSDGGRTWRTSASQPEPSAAPTYLPDPQASLVRVSQAAAYVVGIPRSGPSGGSTVPVWSTTDAGTTWILHTMDCGIPATMARMSAAPTGTLFAICAGLPGAGNQSKSVIVSSDGGITWSEPAPCAPSPGERCATMALFGGYLTSVDAVSSTTAYVDESRGHVVETTDGGASWISIGSSFINTGATAMAFFNQADGVVWALSLGSGIDELWHTADGGLSWSPVTPSVGGGVTTPTQTPAVGTLTAGHAGTVTTRAVTA